MLLCVESSVISKCIEEKVSDIFFETCNCGKPCIDRIL